VFFLIVTDVATGFPTYDFSYNVRFLDMWSVPQKNT
jgi:hypothetical protein